MVEVEVLLGSIEIGQEAVVPIGTEDAVDRRGPVLAHRVSCGIRGDRASRLNPPLHHAQKLGNQLEAVGEDKPLEVCDGEVAARGNPPPAYSYPFDLID